MIKKYCDICGKEVEEVTKFQLPKKEPKWLLDGLGNKIKIIGSEYKACEYDVCPFCAGSIWVFMTECLPIITDESSEYEATIHIDKKKQM